jgi:hypothetical protein
VHRGESALICADCKGLFHYPDSHLSERGRACGTHLIGMREITGWDIVPLCLRCDMAIRLRYGIPS